MNSRKGRPAGWPSKSHKLSKSHKHGPAWFRRNRLRLLRWRAAIHRNPQTSLAYKWLVGTVGGIVIAGGLVLVPFPGPGWLIVFVGVAIVASEFEWARGLLHWGRATLRRWTLWLTRTHWSVRVLIAVATSAFVLAVVWFSLRLIGVPGWVPGWLVPRWLGLQ